jgi:NAD(P)-dependent dehydrogenase (short-subunit alcohol dehydrogenase family)
MQTVLITGATDGIGRETARQLLEKGFRVLVHGRTSDKANATATELLRAHPAGQMDVVYANLAKMREVVALAEQVRQHTAVLDVLINNAGVYENERYLTEEGFELTMAVNHFAHFLLTHALLPLLKAAPAARVITVSSIAHESGRLDLNDLSFAKGFSSYGAYAASKLANVLFTRALAKRLEGSTVTANCLHPGVIATKLLRKGFGMGGASIAAGARTSVYLASADAVRNSNGLYFVDCRPTPPSRTAQNEELAEAFWQATEAALQPFLSAPTAR